MFDVKAYCGELYGLVDEYFNRHPSAVHLKEDQLIWDVIFSKIEINPALEARLRTFDIARIRRAIQDIRNYHKPQTESLFSRQEQAAAYGGRNRLKKLTGGD